MQRKKMRKNGENIIYKFIIHFINMSFLCTEHFLDRGDETLCAPHPPLPEV